MAMTNEQVLELNGKIASAAAGEPIVIQDIAIGESFKKDENNEHELEIKIWGTATDTLLNEGDAKQGSDPMGESREVGDSVRLSEPNKKPFYDRLNAYFKIEPPLVDSPDEYERLFQGTENSVYDQIVGKTAYFRFSTKAANNPKFAPQVYTNLFKVRTRETANLDALAAIKQKLEAKKLAKEAAEAKRKQEEEALFS